MSMRIEIYFEADASNPNPRDAMARKCILHTEVGRDKTTAAIFVTVSDVHEKNFQLSMRSTYAEASAVLFLKQKKKSKTMKITSADLCQISLPKRRVWCFPHQYNNVNTIRYIDTDCLNSAKDAQAISSRV
jgi:hypothetical protein